jgi:DNA polymerase
MARPRLHLDFETFSDVNLITCGEEVYSERAVPLLMGVKLNEADTIVFDYAANFNDGMDDFGNFDRDYAPDCPDIIKEAIKDDWHIVAHNWSFEYAIFRNALGRVMGWPVPDYSNFICTAAKARYWGLPGALEKAGRILNLNTQKDKEGSRLIQKFCIPQKTGRARLASKAIKTIDQSSEDWLKFIEYNRIDVETEYEIDCELPDIPEKFSRFFYSDARMNVRGFPVDMPSVQKAVKYYDFFHNRMEKRFKQLSGGLAPSQVAKVKELLNDDHGEDLGNLQSATIRDRLLEEGLSPEAREMLEIRAETAKASIKKLAAFIARTASDMRAHGGFLWYGAHTGRRSGKGIQPQNFPRGTPLALKQLKAFWKLFDSWVDSLDDNAALEVADLCYAKPLDVMAAALRGFIKATPGKKFVVVDYSQIELRVLAWIAGEEELLELLRSGVDPYINFAANYMYGVDPSEITKDDIRRQIAKSALLGAQYQIWINAFIEYCKATAGIKITLEEGTNAVVSYRNAHPNIVQFWKDIEKAAIFAVETQGTAELSNLRLKFEVHNKREWLRIYLPSGRPISYFEPRVTERITEHEKTDFEGNPILITITNKETGEVTHVIDTYTKRKKVLSFLTEWNGKITREYTYGGKIAENVTQGTAADIMYEGEIIAEENGYPLIGSVHDETVTEVDEDFGSVEELVELVCRLPDCYEGLPIAAEGFECIRYRK